MKVAVIYNKREVQSKDVIDIFGPQTKEQYNPKTVDKVASALEKGGHNVRVIEGNIDVADELSNFMPRVMAGDRPGMVFNMAYGIQGQSRYTHIPALLEMLGVPYVGSGPQAHAVALDKIMTKIVLQQHGLPTPEFWFFSSAEDNMDDVTYPVIVKPKMEAVSMGLKIVHNIEDLQEAVKHIIENFQQQALVERFISGREFAVGMLGNGPDLEILPVVEFDLGDPDGIQTLDDKLSKPVEKICPAKISDELAQEIKRLARESFYALNISDFSRVDLRMDADENLYILELNSMASLGVTGSYVNSAKVAGYTYDSMVNRMLDVAAVRYFGKEYFQIPDDEDHQPDESQPLRIRLRSYVRSNLTTMIDNLRKMADINTYVYNTEGVNILGNLVSARLKQLGFNRQVYPQTEVGNILYFTKHDEEQNDILLIGHLDSVYNYQDFIPYREERGRYFGSGVAESKGGLAVMLTALQSLRYARRLRNIKCGILLITDDTLGGRFSKKTVEELSRRSRYVVGLKYGGKAGGIVTSCSGRVNFDIEMSNMKDKDPKNTANVIMALSQKLSAWQKLSVPEENILVEPTALEARTLYGMAPDYATVALDVHFNGKEKGEELEKEIRNLARRKTGNKLHVRVKKGIYRPPLVESEKSKRFFERVRKIADRLETKIASIHRASSSAVCYVPKEIPVLEGLGPAGGNSRSPDEFIIRDSLIDRATLLALIIRESLKEI